MFDIEKLSGSLSPLGGLAGNISDVQTLDGSLTVGDISIDGAEIYDGDYVVTPDTSAVVLDTKHKYLTDDITVFEIPYWEVSNEQNGKTVYIGGKELYGL